MKELFGIPTVNIMIVLVAILGVAVATVATIGLRNRTMFWMGLRNLPRRGLQTVLVVVGLALATLITTAAFVTGDTVDHSLTADATELFGRSDLDITWNGERDFVRDAGASTQSTQTYATGSAVTGLEAQFADDTDIAAFLPFLLERAPVTSPRSSLALAAAQLVGIDVGRIESIGGLTLTTGGEADLTQLNGETVFLSERAADDLGARVGDLVIVHLAGTPHTFQVAGIVRDEIASGVLGLSYSSVPGGVVFDLAALQDLAGFEDGEINSITVALSEDAANTPATTTAAAERIATYLAGDGASVVVEAGTDTPLNSEVFASRQETIEQGEVSGNAFTTIFLVLGLFSMAAGIILIFMIFVMLAAERKAEMGMSRAVGAQRSHLVQSFIVEGMAYSLLAGVIGVAAGVAASIGLTTGLLKLVGGDYFSLVEPKVTPVALIIGYSLGVVITFLTVIFASVKVSRVNIVAAIRDLPEDPRREGKRKTRWAWVAAGIPALAIPPVGIWLVLRKGFGLPRAWVITPMGLVAGGLFMLLGKSSEILFFFALGISLLPLSVAALASYYRTPGRPLWTSVGVVLASYWLLPPSLHSRLFGEFTSDIEMFVLSGIMIVVSFTLIIVFNARLLTGLFGGSTSKGFSYLAPLGLALSGAAAIATALAMGDRANGLGELFYLLGGVLVPAAALAVAAIRYPSAAPALKMAVAYPLANRFRTGMTIAMFSIIVFSLTVFSILLANFDAAFAGGDARANLDIVGTGTTAGPLTDLNGSLAAADSDIVDDIAAVGLTTLAGQNQAVGIPAADVEPGDYPVLGANDAFFAGLETRLESFANGYASEAAVLEAVRTNPALALVDSTVIDAGFNDSYEWAGPTTPVTDGRFDPFEVQVHNTETGESRTVTVIGTLKLALPASTVAGVYLNEAAYAGLFGEPSYQRFYIRLDDGVDSKSAASAIESALAVRGVEADSIEALMDAQSGQTNAFMRMFQAFMALGLLVGIAGLGVISFRSVVERRQQIGMLRAIGYQRASVTLTFLLESSFVAVMGILSGVIGGAILGRNLLTSESFTEGADIQFAMPWEEVVTVIIASFVFSLAMTWWPSRGASRVPVAEALRYE